MTLDEAKHVAREVVETNIQRMEVERLEILNRLRSLEANITVLKARAEADTLALIDQLAGQ